MSFPSAIGHQLSVLGSSGLIVAGSILLVIGLFVVPLPPAILDFLLVINIVIALILLLRGIFQRESGSWTSFPKILLLATLYRLALNVSSTRLILLSGDKGLDAAGKVIESFGDFVVQGDFVVGGIIFGVIAVVNFLVIARGSARVAEVSARFTLDSLPGQQLAIDSDLRSGSISQEEAELRREKVHQKSQFYGSMDGAMKFVQGDAIAGLVITFINVIGGVSIGVSRGLPFPDALQTFGILTIGDGLVSILPSLLISVCAGIVVTHVANPQSSNSTQELLSQIVAEPHVLSLSGAALIIFSLIPGVPFFPFFLVGAAVLWFSLSRLTHQLTPRRNGRALSRELLLPGLPAPALRGLPKRLEYAKDASIETLEVLTIELDSEVLGHYFVIPEVRERFREFERLMFRKVYQAQGVPLPSIHLRVNQSLSASTYNILVREQNVLTRTLDITRHFIASRGANLEALGISSEALSEHPIEKTPCVWAELGEVSASDLVRLGGEVFSPEEFLVLAGVGAAFDVVEEIFGLGEIQKLLKSIERKHRGLTFEVFDKGLLSLAEFSEILRRLVREHVNIRDLKLILEGVVDYSARNPDFEDRRRWLNGLHSFLRRVLARTIFAEAGGLNGPLKAFTLSHVIEEAFRSALPYWSDDSERVPISPEVESLFSESAEELFTPVFSQGAIPIVVLCSEDIRFAVQDFFLHRLEKSSCIRAIAYEELGGRCPTEPIGVLGERGVG